MAEKWMTIGSFIGNTINFKCCFQIAKTLPVCKTLNGNFGGSPVQGMATPWTSEFKLLIHGARPADHTQSVFSATWRKSQYYL